MSADQSDTILSLKAGNTVLLEALMDMVNQFFISRGDGIVTHSFMSAEEGAIDALLDADMAEEVPGVGYRLLWDKLEERKTEQQECADGG